MTNTVRETRRADELKPGDWAAEILEGDPWSGPVNGQVQFAFPYTDDVDNARVLLVVSPSGGAKPETVRPLAETSVQLLTDEELAEHRKAAKRAQEIADIRAFADFLEANPSLPPGRIDSQAAPGMDVLSDLDLWNSGAEGVAEVRRLASIMGAEVVQSDHETKATKHFGRLAYKVIAWHKDGRPAEPGPEPCDASRHVPAQTADARCFRCGAPGVVAAYEPETGERVNVGAAGCGCPITEEHRPNHSSIEGTERVEHRPRCWNSAEGAEREPGIHVAFTGSETTVCGRPITGLPAGDSYVTSWSERSTCPACAKEAPF